MVTKVDWRIDLESTAFITVDFQRAYLEPSSLVSAEARLFIPKVNELSSMCRKLGIPVIHLYNCVRADLIDAGLKQEIRPRTSSEWETVEGRKGVEFYSGLDISEEDYVIKKVRHSAFISGSSTLEPLLRGLARNNFIICGISTDLCLATTVADAMMLGYRVFVVGDLTATSTDERQKVALQVIDLFFAKVITFEQARQELEELTDLAHVTLR